MVLFQDPSPEIKRQKPNGKFPETVHNKTESKRTKISNVTPRSAILVPETCDPDAVLDSDFDNTRVEWTNAHDNVVINVPETVTMETENSELDSESELQSTVRENSQMKEYSLRSVLQSPATSHSEEETMLDLGREDRVAGGDLFIKPSMRKTSSLPAKFENKKLDFVHGEGRKDDASTGDNGEKSPCILKAKCRNDGDHETEVESPLLLRVEKSVSDKSTSGEGEDMNEQGELINLVSSGESTRSDGSPKLKRRRKNSSRMSRSLESVKIPPRVEPCSLSKSLESPRKSPRVKPSRLSQLRKTLGKISVEHDAGAGAKLSNKMRQTTLSQVLGNSANIDRHGSSTDDDADVQRAIELSLIQADKEAASVKEKENSPPFKRPQTPRKSKSLAKEKLKSPNKRNQKKSVKFTSCDSNVLPSLDRGESQFITEEQSCNRNLNHSVDPALHLSELCRDSETLEDHGNDSMASVSEFRADELQGNGEAMDPKTSTCVDVDLDSQSIPSSYKFGGSRRHKAKGTRGTRRHSSGENDPGKLSTFELSYFCAPGMEFGGI